MDNDAVVFYCANCNALYFAVSRDVELLADAAEDIKTALQRGDRMEIVPIETVMEEFKPCRCSGRQLRLEEMDE